MEAKERFKQLLNNLTDHTNRSVNQTLFLYDLCDDNFLLLLEVEEKLKNNFVRYCPGSKEELDKVLTLKTIFQRSVWINLE